MKLLKRAFYWGLRRESVASTIDGRIHHQAPVPQTIPRGFVPNQTSVFVKRPADSNAEAGPIAITARFRSGSTLLWRLLRSCSSITAYYEPLNPRRWFDSSQRGTRVDRTHRGVSDYWAEYSVIPTESIKWDETWPSHDLYLSHLQPMHRLYDYVHLLVERADNRPVLQFNRIDFRLEWFRHRFPEMSLVHLVRNPRDQWLSTFQKHPPCSKTATVAEIQSRDEFYLIQWANDLSRYIPVLREVADLHPYQLSYLIWRLSDTFAQNYADCSIQYEDMVRFPKRSLTELADQFGLSELASHPDLASIDASSVDRWKQYADSEWFTDQERKCEALLESFVFCSAPTCNQSPKSESIKI